MSHQFSAHETSLVLFTEAEYSCETALDSAHRDAIEQSAGLAVTTLDTSPYDTTVNLLQNFARQVRGLSAVDTEAVVQHLTDLRRILGTTVVSTQIDATITSEDAPTDESSKEAPAQPEKSRIQETELDKDPYASIADSFGLKYDEELRVLHEIFSKVNAMKQVGRFAPGIYSKIEQTLQAARKSPALKDELPTLEFRFLEQLVDGKSTGGPLGALSAAGKLKRDLETKGRNTMSLMDAAPKYLAQLLVWLKAN